MLEELDSKMAKLGVQKALLLLNLLELVLKGSNLSHLSFKRRDLFHQLLAVFLVLALHSKDLACEIARLLGCRRGGKQLLFG